MTRSSGSMAASRGALIKEGVDAKPHLCVANRGRIPTTLGSAATTNTVCAESRRRYKTGAAALSELRLVFANFYIDGAASSPLGQELNPGNAYTIEAAIEITGAPNPVVRVKFSGANTASVPDGAAEFVSDAVYPSQFGLTQFAPSTVFWVRERRVIAIGEKFARFGSVAGDIADETTRMSNGASASQVLATGAMSTPSGGSAINCCFAPSVIIGRAVGRHDIAMLGVGDSIVNGSNDAIFAGASDGSAGRGGWFTVGLWSVNSRAVPHCLMAMNGTTVYAAMEAPDLASAFAKRRVYLKYFTHALDNYGTNDKGMSPAQTVAATYARRQKLWAALRGGDSRIRHITAVPILPRCDSTDSFASAGNQTPRSGYASGSGDFRDPMNGYLGASLAAREIDALLDLNAAVEDAAAPGKWKTDGTANKYTDDGTHPSLHAQGFMAAAWNAHAARLR